VAWYAWALQRAPKEDDREKREINEKEIEEHKITY
jgi:hypothetical protein